MAGKVVGSGCVGECGQTATVKYKVKTKSKKLFVLQTVKTSLCGNTGAYAFVSVNGKGVAKGDIAGKGTKLKFTARPGDRIVVFVTTYPLFNEITCIKLGKLNFGLLQVDPVVKKGTTAVKKGGKTPKAKLAAKKKKAAAKAQKAKAAKAKAKKAKSSKKKSKKK